MSAFRVTTKLLGLTILCVGVLFVAGGKKASAGHFAANYPFVPGFINDYFRTYCGHSGESPAVINWISVEGWPMVTTLNVEAGTSSVRLQYNSAAVVCYPNSGGAFHMREYVIGARAVTPAATISGLVGHEIAHYWDPGNPAYRPHQHVGEYRQGGIPFTYSPSGGFNTTRDYVLEVDGRTINRFWGGLGTPREFACVATVGYYINGWNFGGCPLGWTPFSMRINVAPPRVNAGSCSMNGPGSVYPGEAFNVNFSVSNTSSGGIPPPGIAWPVNNGQAGRYRLNAVASDFPGRPALIEIVGSGVTNTVFGPILYPPGHGRPNTTGWTRQFSAASTGQYTLQYRIWNGSSEISRCSLVVNVVERPYHRVYGGDVFAGAAFGDPCYDPRSRIFGWSLPNFKGFGLSIGSGSQLAVYALGSITDFGSGQIRNNTNPGANNMKNLTFANAGNTSTGNYALQEYGGGLHQENAVCAPDYWENATNIQPDGYTVTGRNLGLGQRQTIYVDGDAYISGPIRYAGGNYNGIGQIPSFRLIARGNIYVAPGATELSGQYVAIPTNATNGRFYTCSNSFAPPTQAQLNPGGACNNRLTVYGSVVADLVKFTRTGGSARHSTAGERYNSGGSPAEVFIYTPESWLSSDFNPGGGADSYQTLPPVL